MCEMTHLFVTTVRRWKDEEKSGCARPLVLFSQTRKFCLLSRAFGSPPFCPRPPLCFLNGQIHICLSMIASRIAVASRSSATKALWTLRSASAPRCFASAVVETPEVPDAPVVTEVKEEPKKRILDMNLRPSDVVRELNKHIVGQEDAKKAVAIAMRNRWRRMQLPDDLKKEVTPRNVLLVGPTGCGKTEVARRMAMLNDAPFRTYP